MPRDQPLDDTIDHDAPSPEDMARFGGGEDEGDYDDEVFDDQPGRWDDAKPSALKRSLIIVGVALAILAAVALAI